MPSRIQKELLHEASLKGFKPSIDHGGMLWRSMDGFNQSIYIPESWSEYKATNLCYLITEVPAVEKFMDGLKDKNVPCPYHHYTYITELHHLDGESTYVQLLDDQSQFKNYLGRVSEMLVEEGYNYFDSFHTPEELWEAYKAKYLAEDSVPLDVHYFVWMRALIMAYLYEDDVTKYVDIITEKITEQGVSRLGMNQFEDMITMLEKHVDLV